MLVIDCALGESLLLGQDIRLGVTGRVHTKLYVFIDAASQHRLSAAGVFHKSARLGIRRRAHVLGLHDGESFSIGPVGITIDNVGLRLPGARALREVRMRIDPPASMSVVRQAPCRSRQASAHAVNPPC